MKRVLPLLLIGGALAAAGCGSSGSTSSSSSSSPSSSSAPAPASGGTARSGLVSVNYQNIAINPPAITVKVGATIKWTNEDMATHNVTALSGATFKSADFGQGATFEYKATTPGVIKYQCTIHPASMNGTITVVK